MTKRTKIIIACCVAAAVVVGGVAWYMLANKNQNETPDNAKSVSSVADAPKKPDAAVLTTDAPDAQSQENTAGKPAATKAPEKVKPTFMYFVTNADLENADTKKALEELQNEYKDQIVFDIKNMETDPTLAESFALAKGQTPTLIMLNTSNDICKILYKTNDKAALQDAIQVALQG